MALDGDDDDESTGGQTYAHNNTVFSRRQMTRIT